MLFSSLCLMILCPSHGNYFVSVIYGMVPKFCMILSVKRDRWILLYKNSGFYYYTGNQLSPDWIWRSVYDLQCSVSFRTSVIWQILLSCIIFIWVLKFGTSWINLMHTQRQGFLESLPKFSNSFTSA